MYKAITIACVLSVAQAIEIAEYNSQRGVRKSATTQDEKPSQRDARSSVKTYEEKPYGRSRTEKTQGRNKEDEKAYGRTKQRDEAQKIWDKLPTFDANYEVKAEDLKKAKTYERETKQVQRQKATAPASSYKQTRQASAEKAPVNNRKTTKYAGPTYDAKNTTDISKLLKNPFNGTAYKGTATKNTTDISKQLKNPFNGTAYKGTATKDATPKNTLSEGTSSLASLNKKSPLGVLAKLVSLVKNNPNKQKGYKFGQSNYSGKSAY